LRNAALAFNATAQTLVQLNAHEEMLGLFNIGKLGTARL
jgi:hypothetical protein